jgi:polynucleotide 5'-kinase involved in rRNA processing
MEQKNMVFNNVYFINGTVYSGKSTMVRLLAEKHDGIAYEENYHYALLPERLTDTARR